MKALSSLVQSLRRRVWPSDDVILTPRQRRARKMLEAIDEFLEKVGEKTPGTGTSGLYVYRPVENAEELLAWARAQGIPNVLPATELHVTQVFSREAVELPASPMVGLSIAPPSFIGVHPLGDKGAVVLLFDSPVLRARHEQALELGATFDYQEYRSHITLSYDAGGVALEDVTLPDFPIVLGAEVAEALDPGWADQFVHKVYDNVIMGNTFLDTPEGRACAIQIGKAPDDPFWRRLHRIADRQAPAVRDAILRAAAHAREAIDLDALERALAAGTVEGVLQALPLAELDASIRQALETHLGEIYTAAAAASAETLARQIGVAGVSFDLTNPRATSWAQDYSSQLVREISEETRNAIRGVVARGFREGLHPYEQARSIRELVGLTERQAQAVYNYRRALENDEIERTTEQEDRMVDRYRDRLVQERAEMIARTETMAASNEGQQELWQQAREAGYLRGDERRIWITTPDDRTCEACLDMDGQVVGLDEAFEDESGAFDDVLVPPLHPNCRCAVGFLQAEEETGA